MRKYKYKDKLGKNIYGNPDIRKFGNRFKPGVGPVVDKYGMSDEEYKQWKDDTIEEYLSNPYMTLKEFVKQNKKKGYKFSVNTFIGWLKRRGLRPHANPRAVGMSELRHEFKFACDREMLETLDVFENKAEAIRAIVRIMLGIPETSIIVKLLDGINWICLFDRRKKVFNGYLTDSINEFETKILQNVIVDANHNGDPHIITDWATNNNLAYIGGTPFEEILSAD